MLFSLFGRVAPVGEIQFSNSYPLLALPSIVTIVFSAAVTSCCAAQLDQRPCISLYLTKPFALAITLNVKYLMASTKVTVTVTS